MQSTGRQREWATLSLAEARELFSILFGAGKYQNNKISFLPGQLHSRHGSVLCRTFGVFSGAMLLCRQDTRSRDL